MMNRKEFWLASAALLVGTAGAQAADLPFRKAAPVEYVRVCDTFGAGFFYIPGTDTCLRISGQLRAEYTGRSGYPVNNPAAFGYTQSGNIYKRDAGNFRGRGYLNADARTQTAYGTLRTYVSFRITQDTTNFGALGGRGIVSNGATIGAPGPPVGVRANTGFFQGFSPSGSVSLLDKAFIQFAGITAGRSQSFFDFDAQSLEIQANTLGNSNETTNLLAYTASFGGGFSATVSAEDASFRRIGDGGYYTYSPVNQFAGGVTAGTVLLNSVNNPFVTAAGVAQRDGVLAYAGQNIPDIVANIRYEASWGSAQLSGAYHDLNSIPVSVLRTNGTAFVPTGATFTPTDSGVAVTGGVKVLIPQLAKGDYVVVQGTWVSGAMDYINPENYQNGITSIATNNTLVGLPTNDAYVSPTGKIQNAQAWSVYAGIRHYFIPEVYGALFGDYVNFNNPILAQNLNGSGTDNARLFQIGGNLIWTPVKDFQIGGELLYNNAVFSGHGAGFGQLPAQAASGAAVNNPDSVLGRFVLRRAF